MRIKRMNLFVKIITLNWPVGISLWPFGIYINMEKSGWCSRTLRSHETVHWNQQREMVGIFFYVWYFIEWLVKLFKYGKQSYYNISFEREARAGRVEPYGWIKYL